MATKRVLRVGCIGLGPRGRSLMRKVIFIPGAKIAGLFDLKPDCIEKANDICKGLNTKPKIYESSQALFEDDKIDAVIIATSWAAHIPLACAAMEAGKIVGVEVGPAMSIQDLFKLVEVQERTKTPLMFLENACFGRNELFAMQVIKKGLLGELIHATGGYQHCVTDIVYNEYKGLADGGPGNERILNRLLRNMEPYPTHGVGPVAKALDINRGNRMLTLTSMTTKTAGLKSYIKKTEGEEVAGRFDDLAQGDVVTTMIKCARGETIQLTWNTSLPVPSSRSLAFYGTNGVYNVDLASLYVDGRSPKDPDHPDRKEWESQDNYADCKHPGWVWYDENDFNTKVGINPTGHGDMDFLMLYSFVECARKGYTFPIDVYDAATWMAISVLAEESLALGSQPVFFPDFTNGKWMRREAIVIDEKFDCNA